MNMTTAAENDTNTGSVPLIPLSRRRNYSPLGSDHFDEFGAADTSYHGGTAYSSDNNDTTTNHHYQQQQHSAPFINNNTMARGRQQQLFATLKPRKGSTKSAVSVVSSYVFDWIIIIAILGAAYYLNNKAPNRRPFSLEDPNIS